MSAVGTPLLQSPGWNEGKARNETLGKLGTQKLRAPLERHNSVSIYLGQGSAAPLGLNKYIYDN